MLDIEYADEGQTNIQSISRLINLQAHNPWPYSHIESIANATVYLFLFIDAFRIKSYIQPFYSSEQCFYRIEQRNKTITEMLLCRYWSCTHKFILFFILCVLKRMRKLPKHLYGCAQSYNQRAFFDNLRRNTWNEGCQCFHFNRFPILVQLKFLLDQQHSLTCFNNRSLLADRQVTRYFVKLKNELSTSSVKCSRDDLCNMNDITRNPRFCNEHTIFQINITSFVNVIVYIKYIYLNHMLLYSLWTFNQLTYKA